MKIAALPAAVTALWAKSGQPDAVAQPDQPSQADGHPLILHLLDVAAVAEVVLEREPVRTLAWAGHALGVDQSAVARWCAALVGLHDFGKACPGFQAKWPDGMRKVAFAGLRFSAAAMARDRHDLATAALLKPLLTDLGWPARWTADVLQAISAHHGFNLEQREIADGRPLYEDTGWPLARRQLFEAYWQTMALDGVPAHAQLALPAIEWLAGLTSLCDWIGSNLAWFPQGPRGPTLHEHFQAARQCARQALVAIGWPGFACLLDDSDASTDALLGWILAAPAPVPARPLQTMLDQLMAPGSGPALMVIEAPMGEGKTEAAFLAHLRLQARNEHRGLYVALPTQATGNAMFERSVRFLRSFSRGVTLDIQLAHGGASGDERVARLRDVWDGSRDDGVASSAWFSQRRRALLSPYGVGTVDQALFAALNVKHHFVRLWGLAHKVVVLDEVHAYDTYTSGLIESLLQWLQALGCSVVLMSATLPAQRRQALFAAWGVDTALPSLAYPRALIADTAGVRGLAFGARPQAPVQVAGIGEAIEVLADQACALLAQGGCGAVIVNTVERAQQLYRQVRERVPPEVPVLLFHARYPADERQQREHDVLGLFGAPGEGRTRLPQALLIATQVAEQSLDIDFDFLMSDLAPVDLLLQRAGRLHRHQRSDRPAAHAAPRLLIAGLLDDRFPDLASTGWGRVYGDYLCLVTWAIVRRAPLWKFPEDIDRLVQQVYADVPALPDLTPEQTAHINDVSRIERMAADQCAAQMALNIALDPAAEAGYAYAGKPRGADDDDSFGLRNRTRLGEEGIAVVPVFEDEQGRWSIREGGAVLDLQVAATDAVAAQLSSRQIKLSRAGLRGQLAAQGRPALFAEHPLLSHLYPLPLRQREHRCGRWLLYLDPDLGLCYRTSSTEEEA